MKYINFQIIATILFLSTTTIALGVAKPKVLYIDSYHHGYAWSDGITAAIQRSLKNKNVELKIIRLDTKRNSSLKFRKKAAKGALKVIDVFQPDIVIASDDNASKHIIMPYFKNKKLPFVFCGINWDEKEYGYPYSNVTGMVEVTPVPQLLGQLKKYASGKRIGFLGPDTYTSKKEVQNFHKKFNLNFQTYFSKNYKDWKKGFINLQKKVDILILDSDGGLYNKYSNEMRRFVKMNIKIPTGTSYEFMAPFALITFAKVAEEQGEWAVKQALKIINGTSPSEIPIAHNKQGKLIFNLKLAEALGIHIPDQDLEYASQIIE